LSFFSSGQGFICDNVVNYEVVLASGDIVNANANDNADLWTGLKGSANNLGIITRYDLRTFEQGKIWGGFLFYFAPSFPSQLEALVKVLHDPVESKRTHLMVSTGYSAMFGGDVMCLNQPYYLDAVENPPVLDVFSKMQPQIDALNTMRLQTLTEAGLEQAGGTQTQVRYVVNCSGLCGTNANPPQMRLHEYHRKGGCGHLAGGNRHLYWRPWPSQVCCGSYCLFHPAAVPSLPDGAVRSNRR